MGQKTAGARSQTWGLWGSEAGEGYVRPQTTTGVEGFRLPEKPGLWALAAFSPVVSFGVAEPQAV